MEAELDLGTLTDIELLHHVQRGMRRSAQKDAAWDELLFRIDAALMSGKTLADVSRRLGFPHCAYLAYFLKRMGVRLEVSRRLVEL